MENWSIANTATVAVDVRVYTKASPIYVKPFGAVFGEDFVTLRIQPSSSQTYEVGIKMIGYWLEDTPTDGAVTIAGWNR